MRILVFHLAALVAIAGTQASAAEMLLVVSGGSNQVLAYDATNGAYLKVFASGNGLDSPSGMALGADGNLYVSSTGTDEVLRFERNTGALHQHLYTKDQASFGSSARTDGNLYVGSFETEAVYKCHGRTGKMLATFGHATGTLAFDINGNLHATNTVEPTPLIPIRFRQAA